MHGGECAGKYSLSPCLLYERDPRGRWERTERTLDADFSDELINEGDSIDIIMDGVDKTIKIYRIMGMEWNKRRGLQGIKIKIEFGYWTEQNGVAIQKPKLTLIRPDTINE